MKKRLPGLICIAATLVLCIVAARHDLSKSATFVRQNEEPLTALAEEILVNSASGKFACPGAEQFQSMVYVKDGTQYIPYVEFFMETPAGYSGFYYSPTGIPIPFGGIPDAELTPSSSGWSWEFMDICGTTSKITDRWYSFRVTL